MKEGDIVICVNDIYSGKKILYQKNHKYRLLRIWIDNTWNDSKYYNLQSIINGMTDIYSVLEKDLYFNFITEKENRTRKLKRILYEK